MDGDSELLRNIAVALGLAFCGGVVARFLKAPPIAGYLVAGFLISPFTPGWNANIETLEQVAELGVIFLLFGVGLHFELKDLLGVKGVAIPGSLLLMAIMTSAGIGITTALGGSLEAGIVVGLAMSMSSSAVIARSLVDHGLVQSVPGRITIGWSIVEDLATILFLALLPTIAGGVEDLDVRDAADSLGRAALFVALVLIGGQWIVPRLLLLVARQGSRELFILVVVAMALGIAASSTAFDVSIALGAFLAGVVISETEMGHQAAADVVPLREAFAALFFVSVGMIVDPRELDGNFGLLAAMIGMIVVGKAVAVVALFSLFPHSGRVALTVAAGLAQVGEFSFLIASAGFGLGILNVSEYNVILTAAVASIVLNPLLFRLVPQGGRALQQFGPVWRYLDRQGPMPAPPALQTGHVIIVGFGRVGELTGHAMDSAGVPFVIVESNVDRARRLAKAGRAVVWGDAGSEAVLGQAGLETAALLVVALPDETSMYLAVTNARRLAPTLPIVVRGHGRSDLGLIEELNVQEVVVPEFEGGLELMHQALLQLGYSDEDAEGYRLAVRDIHYGTEAHLQG